MTRLGGIEMKRINQKTVKEIKKIIKNWLLLVTVNDIETRTLTHELTPLDGYLDTFIAYHKNNTYNIGKFGAYNAIHVQSDMGAMNRDAVMTTVTNAIRMWNPKAIIMIGVAWGMDDQKQKIGDVLVSKKIIQYESVKIKNGNSIHRGAEPDAGAILVDRFKSCLDWEFEVNDSLSQKHIGTLLSGEKLLDDKSFRDKLYKQFPEAIGGDMEGAGLAAIASSNNINEWIIVKGICDWGYNKQTEEKDRYQQIAMNAAISLCKAVLCDDSVLEGMLSVERRQKKNENSILRINAYKLFIIETRKILQLKSYLKKAVLSFFEDISANKFYFRGNHFDKIVGTEFDFEGKCEYVRHIIDETKVLPTEVLFVGNSFNDTYVYMSGVRTLCINPVNTNYTNSIYWHNYIRDLKDLHEILPFVFCED